jgi:hypothetical protein
VGWVGLEPTTNALKGRNVFVVTLSPSKTWFLENGLLLFCYTAFIEKTGDLAGRPGKDGPSLGARPEAGGLGDRPAGNPWGDRPDPSGDTLAGRGLPDRVPGRRVSSWKKAFPTARSPKARAANTTLGQEFLKVAVRKRKAQVPSPNCQQDHLRLKLAPFERAGDRGNEEHPARLADRRRKGATLPLNVPAA